MDNIRYVQPTILGALGLIAREGDMIGSAKVTEGALPTLPTDLAPGGWLSLGEIKNFKITPDRKQLKAEGYNRKGGYHNLDMSYNMGYKITFQTNWLSPEALQLNYGCVKPLVSASADLVAFAAGGGQLKCWLWHALDDVPAGSKEMVSVANWGTLRLTNPITASSDMTVIDWEFDVDITNDLSKLKVTSIC